MDPVRLHGLPSVQCDLDRNELLFLSFLGSNAGNQGLLPRFVVLDCVDLLEGLTSRVPLQPSFPASHNSEFSSSCCLDDVDRQINVFYCKT